MATKSGHAAVVAELLGHGANANFRVRLDRTPLLLATTAGDLKVMRILLEGGADVNLAGTVAIGPRPKRTVEIDRWVEDGRILTRTTHHPRAPEALDVPPLIVATRRNLVPALKLLLEFNAKTEATDNEGMTALAWARKLGHREVEAVLNNFGADPKAELDGSPLHALILASASGALARVVKFLLAQGADPRAVSRERKTPLSIAEEFGRKDIVRLLKSKLARAQ